MQGPAIVNIVNFIRAVEPRVAIDLLEPVEHQVELVRHHRFPATWLLQYDALIDDRFTRLLPRNDPTQDIGIWFEVVQPLVEAAGLTWRGRYPWDWHCEVGFSVGYTPEERIRLADVFMERFRSVYGSYPRSVGSWFMDTVLLAHLADRYGMVASCNCRDQWGTDGYTLWGGYYNQAYYPSRLNAFMPAQTPARQIPLPVFRMLGSDPIYQYDCSLGENGQGVITLEPVYTGNGGGGNPDWVRWFFRECFRQPVLAFGYTQVGQENSFGWKAMGPGLTDQFNHLASLVKDKRVQVQTLAESGAWFKSSFSRTPATAICALTDWMNKDRKSVWYNSHAYRINLFWDGPHFRIRDIHRFDETYTERYLSAVCSTHACTYDTLPVVDGFRWSDTATHAGLYLEDAQGRELTCRNEAPVVTQSGDSDLTIAWKLDDGHSITIHCSSESLAIQCDLAGWRLRLHHAAEASLPFTRVMPDRLDLCHEGHRYHVACETGTCVRDGKGFRLEPASGKLVIRMGSMELVPPSK